MESIKVSEKELALARSRRRFLGLSTGAFAAYFAMQPHAAVAQTTTTGSAPSELDVLNYALTLEYLEATFYTQFIGAGSNEQMGNALGTVTGNPPAFAAADFAASTALSGMSSTALGNIYTYLGAIRDHEQTHVATLITTIKSLGGTPTTPCVYTFPVTSADTFLTVADTLENVGVSAYDGAIQYLSTPALLTASATIATVEARHASFLNYITGQIPFPSAFDMTRTMQEVLQLAAPFLTSCAAASSTTVALVTPNNITTNQKTITLDASASTSAAGNLKYMYKVLSGGLVPAILQKYNSPMATIDFFAAGTYLLQLTVTDQNGTVSTQAITLTYQP